MKVKLALFFIIISHFQAGTFGQLIEGYVVDSKRNESLELDTLFRIHEHFDIDGITTFEIGHEEKSDDHHVKDVRGVFVRSWRLIGMTNYMMNVYTDPEFLHFLAKMMLDFSLAQLELLVEAGLDVLVIEDDIAMNSGPMISMEHFSIFVNHYNRQIVERAYQKGLKVVRHSDGNLWPLLDVLLETGYDGINPLEPQACMAMKKVKANCGDKICLLGNIDCVDLLPKGNAKQVEQAVLQTIEDGAAGGGLIICSSNSLHQGVNPENCIAMFEAVRKHGQYIKAANGSGN